MELRFLAIVLEKFSNIKRGSKFFNLVNSNKIRTKWEILTLLACLRAQSSRDQNKI